MGHLYDIPGATPRDKKNSIVDIPEAITSTDSNTTPTNFINQWAETLIPHHPIMGKPVARAIEGTIGAMAQPFVDAKSVDFSPRGWITPPQNTLPGDKPIPASRFLNEAGTAILAGAFPGASAIIGAGIGAIGDLPKGDKAIDTAVTLGGRVSPYTSQAILAGLPFLSKYAIKSAQGISNRLPLPAESIFSKTTFPNTPPEVTKIMTDAVDDAVWNGANKNQAMHNWEDTVRSYVQAHPEHMPVLQQHLRALQNALSQYNTNNPLNLKMKTQTASQYLKDTILPMSEAELSSSAYNKVANLYNSARQCPPFPPLTRETAGVTMDGLGKFANGLDYDALKDPYGLKVANGQAYWMGDNSELLKQIALKKIVNNAYSITGNQTPKFDVNDFNRTITDIGDTNGKLIFGLSDWDLLKSIGNTQDPFIQFSNVYPYIAKNPISAQTEPILHLAAGMATAISPTAPLIAQEPHEFLAQKAQEQNQQTSPVVDAEGQ